MYQRVTFHIFQNQAFSLFARISMRKSELVCRNVNLFTRVQKNLLFCMPIHFSALFSAHVPTYLHFCTFNPLVHRVLLLNPLVPRVPKVLVKSVQSNSVIHKITYMYVCFECWLAPMKFKQAFFDFSTIFQHSTNVEKYVEKISTSTWKKKCLLKFHFCTPTFPTDVHK